MSYVNRVHHVICKPCASSSAAPCPSAIARPCRATYTCARMPQEGCHSGGCHGPRSSPTPFSPALQEVQATCNLVRPRCAHSQLARDLEPTCLVCSGALTAYHTVLHCVRESTAHRVLLWTTPGLLVHPAGRRVSTPALGTARYSTYEMTEESVAVTCDSDL